VLLLFCQLASPLRAGVDTLLLTEAGPGTGWLVTSVTNRFDGLGSANADDWVLDAEAGDWLSARIETALGTARPRLRVLNPAG